MCVCELNQNIQAVVGLLKSLSNENRLQVLWALSSGEKNVGELEQIISVSQSALSHHLARLRKDGLVETRREAQTIFYSLRCEAMTALLNILHDIYTKDHATGFRSAKY